MKYFISALSIVTIFCSFGQDFSPFNTNNPKRFVNTTNPSDSDYFFYSIQTDYSGDSIIFNQYLTESSYTIDVTGTVCEGWGGYIQPTADTTWLGRKINYNNVSKELIVFNRASEMLAFDFGINQGDSAIFYTDSSDNDYFIRYDNLAQESIFGTSDAVKSFSIWKYDAMEDLMPSLLNDFEIKLSENLGIVSFIDCDQFPNNEKGLTLMGQLNPNIGHYQMTYDEVFPWEPGDTLELKGNANYSNWGVSITSYKLITIDNRVETSDSIWIYLNIDHQVVQSPQGAPSYPPSFNISYPNPIVYAKNESISEFPHNAFIDRTVYRNDTTDFCGDRERFSTIETFDDYCDSCDCFVPFDGNLGSYDTHKYVTGLGETYYNRHLYGNWSDQFQASLIYSNIGGVQCGSYTPLSVDEYTLNKNRELIKVVDLMGKETNEKPTNEKPNTVLIYVYSDGSTEKKYITD